MSGRRKAIRVYCTQILNSRVDTSKFYTSAPPHDGPWLKLQRRGGESVSRRANIDGRGLPRGGRSTKPGPPPRPRPVGAPIQPPRPPPLSIWRDGGRSRSSGPGEHSLPSRRPSSSSRPQSSRSPPRRCRAAIISLCTSLLLGESERSRPGLGGRPMPGLHMLQASVSGQTTARAPSPNATTRQTLHTSCTCLGVAGYEPGGPGPTDWEPHPFRVSEVSRWLFQEQSHESQNGQSLSGQFQSA